MLTTIEIELNHGSDISLIKLVDALIDHAYQCQASDIHIDPTRTDIRIRFRIDGLLQEIIRLPQSIKAEIIARLKVLSHLRTDEHQLAQDGRFTMQSQTGLPIDVRISIAPTYYGENAMLRLLTAQQKIFSLENLGFDVNDQRQITKALEQPYGMILATGPTGSGKTTTLYSLLRIFNKPEVSIITIEDPIEYAVDNITQIQVNPRHGLTFANGLRNLLRQDPNVIMVGEIRDAETADITINAALTGHRVLSSLHTSTAATTLPRLIDMRIEPYLIAATVTLAIGQRLVRTLCQNCATRQQPSNMLWQNLPLTVREFFATLDTNFLYQANGCQLCHNTGYHGRTGIYEVLTIDALLREAFLRKASAREIQRIATTNGMKTMLYDGLTKAVKGITTVQEVLRIIND